MKNIFLYVQAFYYFGIPFIFGSVHLSCIYFGPFNTLILTKGVELKWHNAHSVQCILMVLELVTAFEVFVGIVVDWVNRHRLVEASLATFCCMPYAVGTYTVSNL
jgi:hypothetical protein